jgi:hypothetical protein
MLHFVYAHDSAIFKLAPIANALFVPALEFGQVLRICPVESGGCSEVVTMLVWLYTQVLLASPLRLLVTYMQSL